MLKTPITDIAVAAMIGGALASLLHWPIDDRPVSEVLADKRAAGA
jgi:hypothetical protein